MPDYNQLISKIQNQTLQAGGGALPNGTTSSAPFLGGNVSLATPIENKLMFNEITPYKLDTVYDDLSDGSRVAMFENYIPGTDNNERLAQQQSTTEKWGNGLAKLGIKTATAVTGGTLGILDSLGTLMTTGSLSEAYNSNLNVWLDDFNKKIDYKLPNLYTQQEQDASLFGQMTQANFYADKVFGGLSFMSGAVISEAIWSAATVATFGGTSEILALNTAKQVEKGASWLTKAFGTENKLEKVLNVAKSWAKTPSSSVLDEAGNSVMRGLTNAEKQSTILAYKFGKGADILVPMVRSAGYESGMESRLYMKQTESAWLDKYREQNGTEPSSEEYSNFKDKLTDSANLVFGANMGILSLSNYAQLKNTILGKTTDRTLTNSAWSNTLFGKGFTKNLEDGTLKAVKATKAQKIFGKVYGLGSGFLTEGQEEMSQSVISGTGENYMMAEFDKGKTKSSYGLMESFNDALKKTYGTKEGLTEGLIGGIIGVLGQTGQGIGNKRRGESFSQIDNDRKDLDNAIEYSNEYTAKTLLNNLTASNKIMKAQEYRDEALRNNDISGEKLAQSTMSLLRIQRDNSIGGIDEGLKDFARETKAIDPEYLKEELGFTTDEEVINYKEKLILEHEDLAKNYKTNLAFAESLLGEKNSKIEGLDMNIRTIHNAMAQDLTIGEIARKTDNHLTGVINDEILNLSGISELVEANSVQQVLDRIPEEKKKKLAILNNDSRNLNNRLKTQQTSLISQSKVKEGEEASIRQNKLIELTQAIEKTQNEITLNNEQRQVAINGLGIEQYTDGVITVDSFAKQEENVAKFQDFMKGLAQSNPQKYSKMLGLLAQKSKSIKHVKNYEKAIDLIANKATRLKTVEGWLKKANLKTDPKQYFIDVISGFNQASIDINQNNFEQKENREAFGEEENIENVSEDYIAKLKEQKYESLLKIDQKILDKYYETEGVGIEPPQQESEEKPLDVIQKLKDRVKELMNNPYNNNYIGDSLEQVVPKESDAKEYEALLSKWNRKAENQLKKILQRPSDYKYKNLGLTEQEIDRLKELNETLGVYMTFQGTSAGENESVADLIERINLLETVENKQEVKTELQDGDLKSTIQVVESEAKSSGNQYRGLQTGTDVLALVNNKENIITFSHIRTESLVNFFPNSSIIINDNKTFELNINGRTLSGRENDKGGQVINLIEWKEFSLESNVLIKDFGNIYNAVSQFIGVDSQGKELYRTVESDFNYAQTNGDNLVIDVEEVNRTKKGDLIDLFVSTNDLYNSRLDEKQKISQLHIYAMKNGKLIGSVPAGYADEDIDGVGIQLRDLRKNSINFIKNTNLKGLVKLPYKMEAGVIIVGTPNITLQKDEEGNVTTKQNDFTKESLQNVVGTGYSLNGEITSTVSVDVKQFARKVGEINKDKKIPLIIASINGKTIAFPVDLKSEQVDMSEPVVEAFKNSDDNTKAKVLIQTLLDNDINPNSFGIDFSNSDWISQEKEIMDAIEALEKVTIYKDIDEFTSEKYNLNNLITDATIAIELDRNPFASSKIMLKSSSKLDTDVLGYRENLVITEQNKNESENIFKEVAKDLAFELEKNLALGSINNSFAEVLADNLLIENKNLLETVKTVIKSMPASVKKLVGVELVNKAKILINEIQLQKDKIKSIKKEIEDSPYYSEIDPTLITVNNEGELNNPNILDEQIVKSLGGIKDEQEFEEALNNSNFETLKEGTQLKLFDELSQFNRILVVENINGVLSPKKDNKIAQTIKATLQDDENYEVRSVLSYLEGLSNNVWQSNPQAVKTLLRNVENKAIQISLDLKGLEESYNLKTQSEIITLMRYLDFLLNNVNEENQNNFIEIYEEFFNVQKEDEITVELIEQRFRNKPLVKYNTKNSDYKVFKESGLLRIKDVIFLKTDSAKKELEDVEALMQVNNLTISDVEMEDAIFNEYTEDSEYDLDTLKKLINYRKYFKVTKENKPFKAIKIPQEKIENESYLKTEFISDLHKEKLLNPNDKVLQNLEFGELGIQLTNTGVISLQEMNQYLEINKDLKNYFIISKNTNFEIGQEDNIADERTQIVNGKIIEEFKDSFKKINDQTIEASTNEDFIRVGENTFEKVEGDLFSKLPTNESDFYEMDVDKPILNINPDEYVSQKSVAEIEIKNKYSKLEGEEIDKKIDCSK